MAYIGLGTRTSPITLDDSEDEICYELYKDSNHSSSSSLSFEKRHPVVQHPKPWGWSTESQPPHEDRKRKRTPSFTSYDAPLAGPSVPQPSYTTLKNRLSQPESKKARKRRRKAERQALENARLQNLDWLNGPSPFAMGVPILPPRSWSSDVQMYGSYPPPQLADRASLLNLGLITGFTPHHAPFTIPPEHDDFTLYNREPHSVSPPTPSSRWVSSMAKAAASDPIDLTTEAHDESTQWPPLSNQIPLPFPLPSSLPPPLPHATNASNNSSRLNVSTPSKPVEHHALPPKPPPLQPVQATIGMKPDQDPNSKHGIFQLASATKEAGTDAKKNGPLYMPNPARTLVMEQLPKTHRHPDFINNWGKSACGALPVHIFIDGPGGKALIEFPTAELARKAWASPKLGPIHVHQVKGKAREDLIKVWWYRVDGVGAGSGVGEIEEGEIEGDAIEKEADQPFRRETKKEKKARLAKEREEKRVKREIEMRLIKERLASQQLQANASSTSSFAVPENPSQRASIPPPLSPPWSPAPLQAPTQNVPVASNASSWGPIERKRTPPSMGDELLEDWGSPRWNIGQAGDLDDYDSNMEVDEFQPSLTMRPVTQPLPLHSSFPPRPTPNAVAPLPRVAVQKPSPPPLPPPPVNPSPPAPTNLALPSSRPVYETSPPTPQVAPPSAILASGSSSPLSTPSPICLPSEPRAMKNAPTEPSYTKRALMARQKELEERIAKSKLELAETRAAAGSGGKHTTLVSTAQPSEVKPSMDLGEKQAMENSLRKRVLQSQRTKGKTGAGATLPTDNSNGASNMSATTMVAPSNVPLISSSISASSSLSSSSSSSPVVPSDQPPLTKVSLSTHNFSLEDLAVSFITQTIETIKSQPTPTPTSVHHSSKPISPATTQSNSNNTTKLDLAAKQRRLEQHITESKNLMAKLAEAQTKEEKDTILKAMREMTRSFEVNQSNTTTTTAIIEGKTNVSQPPSTPLVRIWPGSHEDAGILILSDSEDSSCESDED